MILLWHSGSKKINTAVHTQKHTARISGTHAGGSHIAILQDYTPNTLLTPGNLSREANTESQIGKMQASRKFGQSSHRTQSLRLEPRELKVKQHSVLLGKRRRETITCLGTLTSGNNATCMHSFLSL